MNLKKCLVLVLVLVGIVIGTAAVQSEVETVIAAAETDKTSLVGVTILNVKEDGDNVALSILDYTWSGLELLVVRDGDMLLVERNESVQLYQFKVDNTTPKLEAVRYVPQNLYSVRRVPANTCLAYHASLRLGLSLPQLPDPN